MEEEKRWKEKSKLDKKQMWGTCSEQRGQVLI